MLKVTRLTDYAIVLMATCARLEGDPLTARALAEQCRIASPTVSKLMKSLCRAGIVVSVRGSRGGYRLARPPKEISIAEIITAIEGPIGLTDCSQQPPGACEIEHSCAVRQNWRVISATVRHALEGLTLAEMSVAGRTKSASLITVGGR